MAGFRQQGLKSVMLGHPLSERLHLIGRGTERHGLDIEGAVSA
jgi:hypothetical protein